jgi:hypothetical protein
MRAVRKFAWTTFFREGRKIQFPAESARFLDDWSAASLFQSVLQSIVRPRQAARDSPCGSATAAMDAKTRKMSRICGSTPASRAGLNARIVRPDDWNAATARISGVDSVHAAPMRVYMARGGE